MSLSRFSDESAVKQIQARKLYFSHETLTIINNLGLATKERKSIESIISSIKSTLLGTLMNQ